ncbi:MAG: HAD family phosphatase [Clostridia bacterium]|nr:HAD family phosphatase [Clostridia bacterium]
MKHEIFQGMSAAIFDFDGTLMDSMPDWCRKMLYQLDEASIPYPAGIIRRITPMGDVKAAAYFQTLGLKKTTEQILAGMRAYALDAYSNRIIPKSGVPSYLTQLREKGIPMCVLTASPREMITPCLARNGLTAYFAFTRSCDEMGLSKAQTEIYHATAALLNQSISTCVFFDDNIVALRTAKEAGLRTVAVYDETSAADWEEIKTIADVAIISFEELLD